MRFMYGGAIVFNGKNSLYDSKSDEIKIRGHPPHYDYFVLCFRYTPSMLAIEGILKPLHP